MKSEDRKKLRKRAEKRASCLGMGGEETYVNHSDMVVSRDVVISLLDQILKLKADLKKAKKISEYGLGKQWSLRVQKVRAENEKLKQELKEQYDRLTTCPCGGTIIGGCSRCG